MKVYQAMALTLDALRRSAEKGNTEWEERHRERIRKLADKYLPSGSGIVNVAFQEKESKHDRLVFSLSYHHMNDVGYYIGYTDHEIIITPSLAFGIDLRVTGRNKDDIKEYLADVFNDALLREVKEEQ